MKLAWIVLLSCALEPCAPAQTKSKPNVFLITVDTLRADHVHCYGDRDIQTPALDSLAQDGIRFTEAFTPAPITNSSHTTILTGLLPSAHGVTDFGVPLATDHPTWAELLKNNGYHTAAFIGAVILDSKSLAPGLDRGFDFYDNFPEHPATTSRWGRVERRGMDVVTRAEKWLRAHPRGPHFVWVHLYDPHDPYEPPPPFSETYKDRLYDGEIAYADSALANFLDFIKAHGWYSNSVLILVGDHGEGLGEHGEDTHGIFLYDSTTHVPLIIKLPRSANSGHVVSAQVRTTDILPTVLDLVSVAAPARLDGESLRSYLDSSGKGDRVVFGETDYPLRFGWAPLRSVRAEGFKFIEAPRPELYDLKADPAESKNTYAPWDRTVQEFRRQLAALKAKLPPAAPSAAAVPQGTVDELKALGYLGRADVGSSTDAPEPSLLPDPKDKIQEQNLLHVALLADEDGRSADAGVALEKVLELDPKDPTALRQLGEIEFKAGEYSLAATHLRSAREVRPDDANAAFLEGQAREKAGDASGARDALEQSLKLVPGQLPARLLLGKVYLQLKNADAAEDQFEAALLVDATSVEARIGTARAEITQGKYAPALDDLKRLMNSQQNNPEFFELLSKVYSGLDKQKEAQEAEEHAAELRRAHHK
jgi:arylsulfatase A-like enzyme/Flp pilus assembly protein TadD